MRRQCRSAHSPSDTRSCGSDHSGSVLAGPASRQGSMLWTKRIVLHMIVIAGLFLMPGGCPPPDNGRYRNSGGDGLRAGNRGQEPRWRDIRSEYHCNPDRHGQRRLDLRPLGGRTSPAAPTPPRISVDADMQITAVFVQIGNNASTCTEWTQRISRPIPPSRPAAGWSTMTCTCITTRP